MITSQVANGHVTHDKIKPKQQSTTVYNIIIAIPQLLVHKTSIPRTKKIHEQVSETSNSSEVSKCSIHMFSYKVI